MGAIAMMMSGTSGPPYTRPSKVFWYKSWTGLWKDTAGTIAATANGDAIARWDDQSGNGNHATQSTAGNRPTLSTGTTFNSHNSLLFAAASSQFLNLPAAVASLTAAELFLSIKLQNDPPLSATNTGIYFLDPGGSLSHFPYTDGVIYDKFGSSVRKTIGNPTPSLSSQFRVYNPHSATSDWACYLDNSQLFATGSNSVAFSSPSYLGQSSGGGSVYLDGWIVEAIMYDGVTSSGDRTTNYNYMSSGTGSPV